MKRTKVIIFVALASLFCACIAIAADIDRQHYEGNKHTTDFGSACKDCHGTNNPKEAPESWNTCVSCHGDYEALAGVTSAVVPNPHKTHFTDMPCGECHMIHQESSLKVCQSCHNLEMNVP